MNGENLVKAMFNMIKGNFMGLTRALDKDQTQERTKPIRVVKIIYDEDAPENGCYYKLRLSSLADCKALLSALQQREIMTAESLDLKVLVVAIFNNHYKLLTPASKHSSDEKKLIRPKVEQCAVISQMVGWVSIVRELCGAGSKASSWGSLEQQMARIKDGYEDRLEKLLKKYSGTLGVHKLEREVGKKKMSGRVMDVPSVQPIVYDMLHTEGILAAERPEKPATWAEATLVGKSVTITGAKWSDLQMIVFYDDEKMRGYIMFSIDEIQAVCAIHSTYLCKNQRSKFYNFVQDYFISFIHSLRFPFVIVLEPSLPSLATDFAYSLFTKNEFRQMIGVDKEELANLKWQDPVPKHTLVWIRKDRAVQKQKTDSHMTEN